MTPLGQGWIKERVTREMTQIMKLFGALRHYWNYLKPEAGKLRFPCTNKFLWKLLAIWAHSLKNIRQPYPMLTQIEEYQFEGTPNY